MASQAAVLTFHVKARPDGRPVSNQQVRGKFCSICKSAGKSVQEYTSHFVRESRDPSSRVVCPVILSSDCRYCGKKGHMKSHCNALQKRNRQRSADGATAQAHRPNRDGKSFDEVATFRVNVARNQVTREDRDWQRKHSQSKKATSIGSSTSGRFAALGDDSDEEEKTIQQTQRMPSMSSTPLPAPLPYGKMMKRVAAKPEPLVIRLQSETVPKPSEPKPAAPKSAMKSPAKWASVVAPSQKEDKAVKFDFADDFADLDWADEIENNQDDAVETPEWALSAEEKATKQKEGIASLQAEVADGWED